MKLPVPVNIPPADQLGKVHFVGIGGAGLSAIATIMAERGITVSGSDAAESASLVRLRSLGIECIVGHQESAALAADTLVVSTAIAADNPEVTAAAAAGKLLLPRSAGLQSVLAGNQVVAVAGTHGKTTTTAMLTVASRAAGLDPSFAIGAEVAQLATNAHAGSDPIFIAEADESDGAFLVYQPDIAIVTNIDADHLDNYGTEAAYRAAFADFLTKITPGGKLIVCVDDQGAADLAAAADLEVIKVGFAAAAEFRAENFQTTAAGSTAEIYWGEKKLGLLSLQVPGKAYFVDAMLALAAGLSLGAEFDLLVSGLANFQGAKRRMEYLGSAAGVRVFDSYAHHPTEIKSDINAARQLAGNDRLVVLFQPHLPSRVLEFGDQMGKELSAADLVFLTEVYQSRENNLLVTSELILAEITCPATYLPVADLLVEQLVSQLVPGDLLLSLGAGDVVKFAEQALEKLVIFDG